MVRSFVKRWCFRAVLFWIGSGVVLPARAGVIIDDPWRIFTAVEYEYTQSGDLPHILNYTFAPTLGFGDEMQYALKAVLSFATPLTSPGPGIELYDPQLRFEVYQIMGWLTGGVWLYFPASKVSRDESITMSVRLWARGERTLMKPYLRGWVEVEGRGWFNRLATKEPDTSYPQRANIHELRRNMKEALVNDFFESTVKLGAVWSLSQISKSLRPFFFSADFDFRLTRTYGDNIVNLKATWYPTVFFYHALTYAPLPWLAFDLTIEHVGRFDGANHFVLFGDNTTYFFGINFNL